VRVLGARWEAFEADLQCTLRDLNPSGEYRETIGLEALLGWLE
jgi:hypothetical protein